MKKLMLFIVMVFGFTSISFAQAPKIAYIDLQKVIRDSKAGKSAKASFEREFNSKKSIIEQMAKSFENSRQNFIKNSSVMNETTRKQKAEALSKQEKDLRRKQADFKEELQIRDLELTQKILKDIEGILKKIGAAEGYSLIFEKTEAGIVYAGNGVDLTTKVIQAYDAK